MDTLQTIPYPKVYFLGVGRELGNISYGDYLGLKFSPSLLTTSEFRGVLCSISLWGSWYVALSLKLLQAMTRYNDLMTTQAGIIEIQNHIPPTIPPPTPNNSDTVFVLGNGRGGIRRGECFGGKWGGWFQKTGSHRSQSHPRSPGLQVGHFLSMVLGINLLETLQFGRLSEGFKYVAPSPLLSLAKP